MVSSLSSEIFFGESMDLIETTLEEQISPVDLDSKLNEFVDFVKNLQKRDLLDGEVLIAKNAKILLNLRSKNIVSGTTSKEPQFMVGSVSKQFFAVALLKALYSCSHCETEELKIAEVKKKLHMPISQFLPHGSAIWSGNMPSWANEISLHHLLTHTSGIPNYTEAEAFSKFNTNNERWFESYRSASEIIELISKETLLFVPGSQYVYCNTSYVIIADIVEAITSSSQYLQESIFDPLSLSSTGNPIRGQWNALKRELKFSELVPPFKYNPRDQLKLYPLIHGDDISVAKGAGSIISTAADLLKWNQSLHRDQSVLPKELYHLLTTAYMEDYGYGIRIEKTNIGPLLRHSGGIGSYRTLLLYWPIQDLSIVILSSICSDFEQIEDEFKRLNEALKNTISDEKQRNEATFKMILKKYPNTRGFEIIANTLKKLFL